MATRWTKLMRITGLPVILMSMLCMTTSAVAVTLIATVSGNAGPWDRGLNTDYPYGVPVNGIPNSNGPPLVLTPSKGLLFFKGHQISIRYTIGQIIAGGSNGNVVGSGGAGVIGWPPTVPPCNDAPGCYTGKTTLLGMLLGAWADTNGKLVGIPFIVGNGAVVVVPGGADQLMLGINDGWYNDNGGSIDVEVSDSDPCPGQKIGADITINTSPSIWPNNYTGVPKSDLKRILVSLGLPPDPRDVYGATTYVLSNKAYPLGLPDFGVKTDSTATANGDAGSCFFVDTVDLRYVGGIETFIATDVSETCTTALFNHESHHVRDELALQTDAVAQTASRIRDGRIPSRSSPRYVSEGTNIQKLGESLVNSIINTVSANAESAKVKRGRRWDDYDGARSLKLCGQ